MKISHLVHGCVLIILCALPIAATPQQTQSAECININKSEVSDLMRLPYVGKVMAERIVAHRKNHGLFKRPQDVLIIRGMSAKRYRQIAHLICAIH